MAIMKLSMVKHSYDAAFAGTPEKPLAFATAYRGNFPVALVSPAKSGEDLITRVITFSFEEKWQKVSSSKSTIDLALRLGLAA